MTNSTKLLRLSQILSSYLCNTIISEPAACEPMSHPHTPQETPFLILPLVFELHTSTPVILQGFTHVLPLFTLIHSIQDQSKRHIKQTYKTCNHVSRLSSQILLLTRFGFVWAAPAPSPAVLGAHAARLSPSEWLCWNLPERAASAKKTQII